MTTPNIENNAPYTQRKRDAPFDLFSGLSTTAAELKTPVPVRETRQTTSGSRLKTGFGKVAPIMRLKKT